MEKNYKENNKTVEAENIKVVKSEDVVKPGTSDLLTIEQVQAKNNIQKGISYMDMKRAGICPPLIQFFSNFCQEKI